MELIVKTTGRCNFACNFCLAGKADIKHTVRPSPELLRQIDILKPSALIMNGGEPLLSGRDYFFELLDRYPGHIGIVSNLKEFYKNQDHWAELFKHDRISVMTSFQFGTGRKWDVSTPYTVDMFKRVCSAFKEKVGYVPMFISVITAENDHYAIDHVLLAKELGTICKLNQVLPLGISEETYPFYKMIDIWLEIKDRGLEKYTDCNVQFYQGGCNFNTCRMCDSTIRVFYESVDGDLKYASCESRAMQGKFIPLEDTAPVPCRKAVMLEEMLTEKCVNCALCRLCNGCDVNREANRHDAAYCSEMKKREKKILSAGWFI